MNKRAVDIEIGDVFNDGFTVTGVTGWPTGYTVEVYGVELDGSQCRRVLGVFNHVETAPHRQNIGATSDGSSLE